MRIEGVDVQKISEEFMVEIVWEKNKFRVHNMYTRK